MSWQRRLAWVLNCDQCRDGWITYDDEPYVESQEALQRYAESHDWLFKEGRAICSVCVRLESCSTGHTWGRWSLIDKEERPGQGALFTWARFCRVCTFAEFDPPENDQ